MLSKRRHSRNIRFYATKDIRICLFHRLGLNKFYKKADAFSWRFDDLCCIERGCVHQLDNPPCFIMMCCMKSRIYNASLDPDFCFNASMPRVPCARNISPIEHNVWIPLTNIPGQLPTFSQNIPHICKSLLITVTFRGVWI